MPVDEQFGARLRATRLEAGLSQSQLAGVSGVPKTRLSRYENGHVLPSLPTLEKLAGALDVPRATLLGEEQKAPELLSRALDEVGIRIESERDARVIAEEIAALRARGVGAGR